MSHVQTGLAVSEPVAAIRRMTMILLLPLRRKKAAKKKMKKAHRGEKVDVEAERLQSGEAGEH